MSLPGIMPPLSREEIAKREIGRTEIRPATAWFLIATVLGTLVAVPIVQVAHERRQPREELPQATWPSCFRIFSALPVAGGVFSRTSGGVLHRVAAANDRLMQDMHEYEDRLEDESWLSRAVRPSVQYALTRWGG